MLEGPKSSFNRLRRNIIPDIAEKVLPHQRSETVSRTRESPQERAVVLDTFCPPHDLETIRAAAEHLQIGSVYRARVAIGTREEQTLHPHDFIIEPSETDIALYFIDPEHHIGTKHWRRPPISNLMALRIPRKSDECPDISIIRYMTPHVAAEDITSLKLGKLLEDARHMLEKEGIPDHLQNHVDDITFRLHSSSSQTILQSRLVSKATLDEFLDGTNNAAVLQGKVDSQHAILQTFIRLLRESAFAPIDEFGKKKAAH